MEEALLKLWNYVSMGLMGAGPGLWIGAGLTFLASIWIRRTLVVYAIPAILLIVTLSFALEMPSGSSWSVGLMLADLSGLRWMFHTVFATDQGAAYYNTAPVAIDNIYAMNRMIMLGLGTFAFALPFQVLSD